MNKKKKRSRLAREIAGIMAASVAVAVFVFFFIDMTANSIAANYIEHSDIRFSLDYEYYLQVWIAGISLTAAIIVFIVLFMFLLGQKLQYLEKIIEGVDALRTHRMEHVMPVEGSNEFTELAEAINYLSETERYLKEKERRLADERESFVRSLSHDIRTPLTMIMSYTQIAKEYGAMSRDEISGYLDMVQKKSMQIKLLTDKLLEDVEREPVEIESGRLLMQQLAEEWSFGLEENFDCVLDYDNCPDFHAKLDVGDVQRIFDNLASNVEKYADPSEKVYLEITESNGFLAICQSNGIKIPQPDVESHKLGLYSIRRIAEEYGGSMEVTETSEKFIIKIFISLEFFRNS